MSRGGLWALTRLSCVLSGGTGGRGLFEAVDGDWLVDDEEPADHLPFAGPEQSYTVQDKQHEMRPQLHLHANITEAAVLEAKSDPNHYKNNKIWLP